MLRTTIPLLALLLVSIVYNVWGLGIVHRDDAIWHLHGVRSDWGPIWSWAQSQGRAWALFVGPLMLHAARWKGTFYGEIVQLGPFVAFFLLLHVVTALYFGRRAAIVCAALFCSLFALRFEGSILICYGLVAWPSGIACCLAIIAGRYYTETGGRSWQMAAALLLLISLLTNEALALAFLSLVGLSWLGNVLCRTSLSREPLLRRLSRRDRLLAATWASVALAYGVLASLFLVIFPSTYDGHALAPIDPGRIFSTLTTFALNGSTLFGLFKPYAVTYVDRALQSGVSIDYRLVDGLRGLASAPLAVLAGLAAALVIWSAERGQPAGEGATERRGLSAGLLLFPGLILLILPIAPVALTSRYQNWHLELGVNAYISTVMSHFGASMILTGVLISVTGLARRSRLLHLASVLTLSVGVGLFALIGTNLNARIAQDMRPESARWAVFERALSLLDRSGFGSRTLIAPQFQNGSWFSGLPASYWRDLALSKYGEDLRFTFREPTIADLGSGVAELSYFPSDDGRTFDLLLAHIGAAADGTFLIDRIVVEPGQRTSSGRSRLLLSYVDRGQRIQHVRVSSLKRVRGGSRTYRLDGIQAIPGTVRLVRQATLGEIRGGCGDSVEPGTTIVFGGAGAPEGSPFCVGNAYLGAGWAAPESTGVWTNGEIASITLPAPGPARGPAELEFHVASFTSLGFFTGTQRIFVSVNGGDEEIWEFSSHGPTAGATFRRLALPMDSQPEVEIRLRIAPTMNPRSLGLSKDERDLGAHLRSITLR